MILAFIYFLVFIFIIKKSSFFKDDFLSFKIIVGILFLKVLGCFAYYWIYFNYYPGSFVSDSSSTMHDASIIYNALPNNILDYLKMIFGYHTNFDADPLYQAYFKNIDKWGDSDSVSDFLLNDNKTLIRLNAIFMLFSFGKYAVHALFMLMLSFIGQFAFYKTFQSYFKTKEIIFACIVFVTPSILFWTSGVLKEPVAIFLLGIFVYSYFKVVIHKNFTLKYIILLILSIIGFTLLKPYILILILIPLVCFTIVHYFDIKRVLLFYTLSILLIYGTSIAVLKIYFHKDLVKTIVTRQNDFINLSKGGIFFLNSTKYVRLEPSDYTQYEIIDSSLMICRIKPHAKLMYWNVAHINNLRDTLFDFDNRDSSLYHFHSGSLPSGSGVDMQKLEPNLISFVSLLPQSLYNVLCKPFFYDSHSVTELMASLENLLFLIFFVVCLFWCSPKGVDKNLVLCLFFITLTSFVLIGLTTTVMGAIVRYKIPFLPFLLMISLSFLDRNKLFKNRFMNRVLKKQS